MKYIPAEKLIAEIERLRNENAKSLGDGFIEGELSKTMASGGAARVCERLLSIITAFKQDQVECIWIHKKYNREYRIVSDNARLKNSNGEWIDCVVYAPLYENEFEMFAREKDSFYKEFEKK